MKAMSKDAPHNEEMNPLAGSLVGLYFSLERIYESASKEAGISAQQAQLLCAAGWKNPALGELAETLHCDKTNVTGLVDRVEKQGLVSRVADPADRRVTRLELTEKGRAKVNRFHEELNRRLGSIDPKLKVDANAIAAVAEQLRDKG